MSGDARATDGSYAGLLFIGDPHLASRVPGFRRDDYPRVVLEKFRWSLDYARVERLLPIVLGDLFHYPRDNANWLLVELMDLLRGGDVLAVWGNHDCSENSLSPDDTLSVLFAAGKLRALDGPGGRTWTGLVNGVPVAVGGTSWGRPLPEQVDRSAFDCPGEPRWVFWVAHHDLRFPNWGDPGWTELHEIPGADAVVNGHIHKWFDLVKSGRTTWLNPGNISRIARDDITRAHTPAVLRVDVTDDTWKSRRVSVPHEPFERVFYDELTRGAGEADDEAGESAFINGLRELQTIKTAGGAGLRQFLEQNLGRFEEPVAAEIRRLAAQVLTDSEVRHG